ncbi:MAG: ABC transporter ATP-binding protein [Acidobacteria bacterium]|nr:ABC transporter ATP-binding protein [Acidobacteriota bacterium]
MTLLAVDGLHTYYGESHVLQGVTFTADAGTVTAVLGRNGVGKTTLCRSLAGLTPARRGRVTLDGADITRLPPHRIHALGISLVPQGRHIFPSLTVHENLAIAARAGRVSRRGDGGSSRGPADGWDLDEAFAVFPRLAERAGNRGNELSGGEQQMLAIARALVARPLLLVMDEPTEGLAPALVAEVAAVIGRLRDRGTSILLAEQNAAFAVTVADAVHVMSRGTVVLSTDPVTLWNNEDVKTQLLGVPPARQARHET